MTLDEAIEHAEWVAENTHFEHGDERCNECSEEHRQLARWLRELRSLRAHLDTVESQCDELGDENAKLRGSVAMLSESRDNMLEEHRWLERENARLQESLIESRQANEHLNRENRRCRDILVARHQRAGEALFNAAHDYAKLSLLVSDMYLELLNAYDLKELEEYTERIRELGIEVDDGAR